MPNEGSCLSYVIPGKKIRFRIFTTQYWLVKCQHGKTTKRVLQYKKKRKLKQTVYTLAVFDNIPILMWLSRGSGVNAFIWHSPCQQSSTSETNNVKGWKQPHILRRSSATYQCVLRALALTIDKLQPRCRASTARRELLTKPRHNRDIYLSSTLFFSWGACNEKPLPPFYRWCQNKYPAITALFLLSYTSSFIHWTKCRGDVSKMMRLVVCERDREKGSEAAFSSDCSRLIFVPTKLVAQPHRSGSQWKAPPAGHVLWSHAVP